MTFRAIAGIAGLNVFFLGIGACVLWSLGAWRWWTDLVRLAGLAYLVGVTSLSVVLTLELVAGTPVNGVAIALTGVALPAVGLAVGRLRSLPRPGLRPSGRHLPRLTVWSGLLVAAIVLYFEALFRSARLQPLSDWDTWWVWTLRAKAIFEFEALGDPEFVPAGAGGAYPPGLSLVQAAAFHAMGSTDVVTLHLLHWSLAVGFVGAVAGLLVTRVRPAIVLPFLLLILVMPSVTERITDGKADLPLAYATAVAALLVLLWLEERQSWQLAAGTVLLAGCIVTKREGLLLAACVLLAAFASSWGERRRTWPLLAGSSIAALALSLPWRMWFNAQGLPSDAPEAGYLGFLDHLDRIGPSAWLVVRTLFDYDLWLILPVLAVGSIVLAFWSRSGRVSVFATAFLSAAVLASTWVIASNPGYEITQDFGLNPVVRLVGDSILVLGALTPLVLERAWHRHADLREPRTAVGVSRIAGARAALPWAIVLVAALGYPASMLAGTSVLRLPGGPPSFPSPEDCIQSPVEGEKLRVVFGYEDTYAEANALRKRAASVSPKAKVAQDGCGRLRVFLDDVPSLEAGGRILGEAARVDLFPTLERDPD